MVTFQNKEIKDVKFRIIIGKQDLAILKIFRWSLFKIKDVKLRIIIGKQDLAILKVFRWSLFKIKDVQDNYWKAGFSHIKGFSDGHFSK